MRLSAKAGYAVKAMSELAGNYGSSQPLSVEVVAERQCVPRKFLVQIFIWLAQAGLVRSTRGLGGGYQLVRPPSKITLLEIFNAVDKSVASCDAADETQSSQADLALEHLWEEVHERIAASLNISLEQFLASVPEPAGNYQI